jgi:quercetin dioxygenase-like cupin family protein
MQEKTNRATPQRPEGDRLLDASLVTMDLLSFMEQIKREESWKDSDRNAITIYKTAGMTITLVALKTGALMKTHTTEGILSVQVLEGRIQFDTQQRSVVLDKGQMLALHERIPHSVLAQEESVFLLTLATGKMEERE